MEKTRTWSLVKVVISEPFDATVAMGTAIKHPVSDRVKPSFAIFDIRALWRLALSVRVKGKADDLYRGSMQFEDHRRTALQYPLVHWTLPLPTIRRLRPSQGTKLYCLVNRGTLGVNNLPMVVARIMPRSESTSWSRVQRSNHYTTESPEVTSLVSKWWWFILQTFVMHSRSGAE